MPTGGNIAKRPARKFVGTCIATDFSMNSEYLNPGPSREAVDELKGAVLLEFGTGWCGYCQAAASLVAAALRESSGVEHIKVEDGPGRQLGRSFRVKLWPTLIALKDGVEIARIVRPQSAHEVRDVLKQIS
jgi:thioredoxin 1